MKLIPVDENDCIALLTLNNDHAIELSLLDANQLQRLLRAAFYAYAASNKSAFMIAFDQEADYHSPNFLWFRDRFARFVYVDRVVVDPSARRQGVARELYQDLFAHAQNDGHTVICCEVNRDPPNPASDRFHGALGFEAVGEAMIASGKSVRYLARKLPRSSPTLSS